MIPPPHNPPTPGHGAPPPPPPRPRRNAAPPADPAKELRDALLWMGRTACGRVADAVRAVCEGDLALADRVVRRDSQIDIANDRLHHLAFARLEGQRLASQQRQFFRAAIFVSQNIERIGDSAADMAKQARQLADQPLDEGIARLLREALPIIEQGVQMSLSACLKRRLDDAREAMTHEDRLDALFRKALGLVRGMGAEGGGASAGACEGGGGGTGAEEKTATATPLRAHYEQGRCGQGRLATLVLLLKNIERIGDFIQNIAEQALFLVTGQRLKYGSLLELERLLGKVGPKASALSYRNLFEGRSGARVARVKLGARAPVFFKQGEPGKIGTELEKMAAWNELVPGVVPRMEGQSVSGGGAAFLSEFLNSVLFRDLLLDRDEALIAKALRRLLATLEEAWNRSLRPEPPRTDYAAQIRERLEDIFVMHPALRRVRAQAVRVGGATMPSLEQVLARVEAAQPLLAPPASVWIHGDFNADNVFYDSTEDSVYFVDVHRSGWGDYAQDVSVFMVGNVRSPLLPRRVLERMGQINATVEGFARDFAKIMGDGHFEQRMRLARGRSLITSARLMPDKRFARRLFLEGMYLLDLVAGG